MSSRSMNKPQANAKITRSFMHERYASYFITASAAWYNEVGIMPLAVDFSILEAVAQINEQLFAGRTHKASWMPQRNTGSKTWCKHGQFTCFDLLLTAATLLLFTSTFHSCFRVSSSCWIFKLPDIQPACCIIDKFMLTCWPIASKSDGLQWGATVPHWQKWIHKRFALVSSSFPTSHLWSFLGVQFELMCNDWRVVDCLEACPISLTLNWA